MTNPQTEELRALLSEMLDHDEDVSARNVARRSDGRFKHASDLTRHPVRRAILADFQYRQTMIRNLAQKLDKDSRPRLLARLAAAEQEVAVMKAQQALLIAGLRATIHAVGQLGGMRAWRQFFPAYQGALKELIELGAVPSAAVVPVREETF